jgi:hypothetical protein
MADSYDPEAFDFAMPRTSTDPKQAGEFVRGAKYAPFDLLGAPVDIVNMAMGAVGVPVSDKPVLGSEFLIDKYADLVEAFGSSYDRPTGSTAETAGRLVGGAALDPALLAAGIGRTFARTTTKTRGSGIEKKGTGTAQAKEVINTKKAYKLFEQDPETGTLYPLFVDAKTPVKVGEWQKATLPDTAFTAPNGKRYVPSKKWDGKAGTGDSIAIPDQATREMLIEKGFLPQGSAAKSIKAVALRPGWHSGEFPVASHIGPEEVVMGQKMKTRGRNQVWAEVEVPDDVDWQTLANERASIVKSGARKGEINRAEAQITDELPLGGNYKYQQGQARDGNWVISGEMRVNRVLDDDEVRAINEAGGMQDLPRLSQLMAKSEPRTSDLAPVSKKEVLEGDIVGEKTAGYEKLQKDMEASSSSDLRSLKGLKMELKGVEDAFSLNAGINIDKSLEFASNADSVRYTSDDFIAGVQDSFEYARDQGIDRGEALLSALRENVDNFNDIYPDALDLNSVLSDISKNVNDDFGFDKALSRFQQGQANRSAMEAELTTAKAAAAGERANAQSLRFRESLGITKDTSPDEAQRLITEYANNQQGGISGAGIPDPTPPKPNLRLVKKAAGGKVDLRSGIGDIFKVYS